MEDLFQGLKSRLARKISLADSNHLRMEAYFDFTNERILLEVSSLEKLANLLLDLGKFFISLGVTFVLASEATEIVELEKWIKSTLLIAPAGLLFIGFILHIFTDRKKVKTLTELYSIKRERKEFSGELQKIKEEFSSIEKKE